MINIGQYIETAINWLTEHFASFFDALSMGIGGFIDGFQHVLFGIPFYITIAVLAALAWFKSGKGTAVFTLLGLLLIYGMGFWEETMQTLALVLSSTCLALLLGVPLGIWTANSPRLYADNACLCLSDSCRSILRIGNCAGSFCHHHLCNASCGSSDRSGHSSGS